MNGSNKILTVSYGTFSCTLEGFEDPFNSMRSIAEYFRDLAADDRYFGAEPPTPDVEMLQALAERETRGRVAARVSDTGVALTVESDQVARGEDTAPLTSGDDFMSDEPEDALVLGDDAPLSDTPAETIAEKLSRIRAVVSRQQTPVSAEEFAEDGNAPQPPRSRALTRTLSDIAADIAGEDFVEDAEVSVETDDTASHEAVEQDEAEADAPHMEAAEEDETDASDGEDWEISATEDDEADDASADAEEEHGEALEDAGDGSDWDDPLLAGALRKVMGESESEDDAEDTRIAPDETAVSDEDARRFEAAIDAVLADKGDEVAEDVAEAQHEGATDDEVEGDLVSTDDGAFAEADTSADEDTDIIGLEISGIEESDRFGETEGSLLDEDDEDEDEGRDDLMAKAAMFAIAGEEDDADGGSGKESSEVLTLEDGMRDDAAEAAHEDENAFLDDGQDMDDHPGADVETPEIRPETEFAGEAVEAFASADAGNEAPTSIEMQEADDTRQDDETGARNTRRESRLLEPVDNDEAAVGRLMSETEGKLADGDSVRRRRVISQMRAAVAATRADRILSRMTRPPSTPKSDDEEYRRDLDRVVSTKRESTPLVLVSEQRIPEATEDAEATPSGAGEAADEARKLDDGFARFASDMNANDLPELLEAAAAYTAFVEGEPHFSRPDLMRRVAAQATEMHMSREQGLRSFGQLLREGKIRKLQRGQFTIDEGTRFNPAHRIAGE